MSEDPTLEEAADDLELATELLPRIPQDEAELQEFRWAIAQALATERRSGANAELLRLADELEARANRPPSDD